jgi:serine/threonine protein kinase
MNMMNIKTIPLFQNKKIKIHENIYSNDLYPACFLVSDGISNYKVRFASSMNPNAVVREFNAMEYLKNKGMQFNAHILEAKTDGTPETQYIVETFISGKSIEKYTYSELKEYEPLLINNLILCLSEMHNLCENKFHSFIGDIHKTYAELLETRLNVHISIVRKYNKDLSKDLHKIIELIHTHKDSMKDIVPSFIHLDIKPQNIIFDVETLKVSLIDFEQARFGDPFHELVKSKFKFAQNTGFFKHLWTQIENSYIKKIGVIPTPRKLIYQLYFYVTEISYFYRIGYIDGIRKQCKLIEKTFLDLHQFN